ncbi:MAG TPA: TolC family protein [Polyangiales bacterium]|nr:TolC family protein [Polyangiales bacterium]
MLRSTSFLIALCLAGTASADDAPSAASADMNKSAAPSARVVTLAEAIQTARTNAPAVHVAQAQAQVADATRLRSESSLLPSLTGTANYLRTQANLIPRPGSTNIPRATTADGMQATSPMLNADHNNKFYNSFQFGLTASMLLYDFQGSINRFRSAKEAREAARDRAKAAELTSDLNVRTAFFQARVTRALVSVAKETLDNNQRHLDQIQAFVTVGTRPEIDLAQTRTDYANARVQLVQAENDYAISKATLLRYMGVADSLDFEVADEQIAPVQDEGSELDLLLRKALVDRPDVSALSRDLKSYELQENGAKSGFAPAITGTTQLTAGGIELGDIRYNVAAGVGVTWPLLSGTVIADLRAARANRAVTQASIADIQLSVRLQIEQARLGLVAAIAADEAAGEALENARVRHRLAEGRYEAGVGNVIELGDAQVALTTAESQAVQAENNISTARAQLLSALGRVQ